MTVSLTRWRRSQQRLTPELKITNDETLRRHATKPGVLKYGEAEMRCWYRGLDLLPGGIEQVIPADSALESTVTRLMADAGLSRSA